ncbi:uncharacterized protein LOC117175171 isoform X1 [Belonocnema kinseyi]|uniref:uncharacterized protein LOC117175171 isoform X1 n=1 Tax=Belonocnema kinseyi TaxID=2817044 RepID=UPI00143D8C10|nr:uncharacterized protein LOC117175171 isoform X1 [Belonocnema kinseyi]XP_033220665.1 uncharacterized protein LOC117175171 isoform X1 [Belonocnema kinseyi]XP_033220666.1 uncharacterized protein LOC117175171 isoform X1 [Belonocnema kinseyi]
MWPSLFFGLPGFVSAQEADVDAGDIVNADSAEGQKMPSTEELLQMVDSMGLAEDEKQNLIDRILKGLPLPAADAGVEPEKVFAAADYFTYQTILFLSMVSLITLIFVFFGYKLYTSLSERERKREEKRKLKQMKKKK